MAESNRKPTRCPCGFFGSSQTLGLCSKCFREREQSRGQMTADVSRSSGVSMETRIERETSRSGVSMETRIEREVSSSQEDSRHSSIMPCVETESDNRSAVTETSPRTASLAPIDTGTASIAVVDTLLHQRGRKRKADELDIDDHDGLTESVDDSGSRLESATDSDVEGQPPVQKNKKRCFACNCRMALAIREIGKCKCDYVFCAFHRLPEQHNCAFDHKEHSRQEARAKMVVLRKHIGTSLKRLDSDT